MKIASALMLAAALAAAGAQADRLEVRGGASARAVLAPHLDRIKASSGVELEVVAVGTGQAMLDLVDGRTDVVAVAVPLAEAVGAAREAAWAEGRLLRVPALAWHPIDGVDGAGFVTLADR